MMKKKITLVSVLAALLLLLSAVPAFAHVTIQPREAVQGSYTVFTVRVPSETAGTETIAVRVVFPEGVSVTRFEPKTGWTADLERGSDDSITAVTWTAEEGYGLAVTEFTEFRMSGRVLPEAEGQLVWKAYQTYADGSAAEWIGAPGTDSPHPAPVTEVVAGSAESDGHGHGGGAAAAADNDADKGGSNDTVTLALAIAALALSIIALALALVRRKRA